MIRSALAAISIAATSQVVIAESLSPEDLQKRSIERRAVEAVIWGMPAVNFDLMRQAAFKAGAKENEVVFWSRPVDWHNQTLTPNPDAIYLIVFFNTQNGPVVIEFPPAEGGHSITANIDDIWQMPLEDAGPSGADQGKGGKYLILPPGYAGSNPAGYIALRALTYGGYALIRSNLASHAKADVAGSVEYGKLIKVYDFKDRANPPATKFTDAFSALFDSTISYDERFFDSLNRIVQNEPWIDRDRAMIDPLRSIGIEKGKPFTPDASTKSLLVDGIREARALLDHQYETRFPPYWPTSHWAVPALNEQIAGSSTGYADPNSYPLDARAITYTIGYVGIKRLGAGQFYLITSKDRNGEALDGSVTYRLNIPAEAPAQLYWSVTVYDRETHALVKNMSRASRASNAAEVRKNPDGSTDVYFGPSPPPDKEPNWVPTDPKRRFELLFRLYAPTKPLFDKTWVLPDVERSAAQ